MRLPILLALILALSGCNEDADKSASTSKSSKVAEAAKIEREVARRVETAKLESTVRTSRLHTIRIVGFTVLAGGAACCLIWLQYHHRSYNPEQSHGGPLQMPSWRDHYPVSTTRVLDLPPPAPPPAARIENPTPPRHRRVSRHRNHNRRNHHDDKTSPYR